jgi:hypothetical protein
VGVPRQSDKSNTHPTIISARHGYISKKVLDNLQKLGLIDRIERALDVDFCKVQRPNESVAYCNQSIRGVATGPALEGI